MYPRVMKIISLVLACFLTNAVAWGQGQSTIKIEPGDSGEEIVRKAAWVVPTINQYAYKKLEYNCFVHFGPNTFTRNEWGSGMEDPKTFDLQDLDTDQWCRAMKDAGMKLVVFTAKHHDGFVLWQSRYTRHGVMSSPFRDGKGDVLKDLAASCSKYGIKLGVYLSPADLYQIEHPQGLYGNLSEYTERVIPRPVEGRPFANKTTFTFNVDDYNEYFLNQLFELLTEYGPIHEVWFDGAHPKRKGGQKYNYLAWKKLIRTLAPEAVIFGKEDVRWCGNESGGTRVSEWDVIPFTEDPGQANHFPDIHGDPGKRESLAGAKYLHYLPAETNTSIREGWFYRDEETQRVRNADDVFDIYERSVGGNSTFLLNIPPNRKGRFPEEDVTVLREVGKRITETYGTDLLAGAQGDKALLDDDEDTYLLGEEGKGTYVVTLPQPITLNRFLLQEAIKTQGQRIEKHVLEASVDNRWQRIAQGTTVGYKKILRFPAVTTRKLRLRILEARTRPSLSKVSAHYYKPRPPRLAVSRSLEGQVTIQPVKDNFNWKLIGIDYQQNLGNAAEIRYTIDGTTPTKKSSLYSGAFFHTSGVVKARAFEKDLAGGIVEREFGMTRKDWTVKASSAGSEKYKAHNAIDGDVSSFWHSDENQATPTLTIDLKQRVELKGLIYTPPANFKEGLIEQGAIKVSRNGKSWKEVQIFDLGNLVNDPTPRTVKFDKAVKARYVQVSALRGAGGSTSASVAEIELLVKK